MTHVAKVGSLAAAARPADRPPQPSGVRAAENVSLIGPAGVNEQLRRLLNTLTVEAAVADDVTTPAPGLVQARVVGAPGVAVTGADVGALRGRRRLGVGLADRADADRHGRERAAHAARPCSSERASSIRWPRSSRRTGWKPWRW